MEGSSTSVAFEALKEFLRINNNAKVASGGKEVIIRCPYCGDSADLSSAHLYIGIANDGIMKYNCFKCDAGGTVNGRFLNDIGCDDQGIIDLCNEQNHKFDDPIYTKSGALTSVRNLQNAIIPLSYDAFAQKKLEYISNRLGVNFNANDAARFKIILNLKDFLDANNITRYSRHESLIPLLNNFFVGFLSRDNRYVILRRLVPEGKLPESIDTRFVNYNITGTEGGKKYYTIPNWIDVTRPMEIHVAEGAFDILSIYMHVAPIGSNGLFTAIAGKSYMNMIQSLIMEFGFIGFTLHIYPDLDIEQKGMYAIKRALAPFNIPVYIHRNLFTGEKDFGVHPSRIIDGVQKI